MGDCQVSRLQEQLQAERDLRAALEVGLSMSSGQFSSSRGMDSKVCINLDSGVTSPSPFLLQYIDYLAMDMIMT